jgi:hypothetical protein
LFLEIHAFSSGSPFISMFCFFIKRFLINNNNINVYFITALWDMNIATWDYKIKLFPMNIENNNSCSIAEERMMKLVLGFIEQWNNRVIYGKHRLHLVICVLLPMLFLQELCSMSSTTLGELLIYLFVNYNEEYNKDVITIF